MTYWCENCHSLVDEDDVLYEEGSTVIDGRRYRNPYEDWARCPHCGEEISTEAIDCPICGNPMAPDRYICEDCEDDISVYVDMGLDGYAFDKDISKEDAKECFELWLEQKGEL